ncbi:MAG: threonylcarbamoyl-AMP synthase [Bacteroidales bacterium]|nr:L-threonylcarbamoyladenylate synthase [Anaerotignum sp.]MCI5679402.1 threonylcarbamoyl-AMP synthase [Bacteroidales bacterium]MDY3927502.1 L-threonylcarbamoyladenylate synthase [Anaerotignum sp.]
MKTILAKVDLSQPESAEVIQTAAKILQEGGLVAFPTETVYGLGGNGLDGAACEKIYLAKGRPSDNPLILHISEFEELDAIVREISPAAKKLMDAFWPGPLTMVFPKADIVPVKATGGLDTVAVRFPSHPVARAIIKAAGLPIAAPSANSSGKPSPTRASHVEYDLNGKIDMIVDGGAAEWGLESTIVDVSGDVPMILRPGAVTKEMMEEVVGRVEIDPAILTKPAADLKPKAPGMKYTHYSPKAEVILVKGERQAVADEINRLAAMDMSNGKKTGVMATEETKDLYHADIILSLGSRERPEEIGANLFKLLRKFDFLGAEKVYSEVFSEEGEGMAIMNRLNKAAGYQMIEAKKAGDS